MVRWLIAWSCLFLALPAVVSGQVDLKSDQWVAADALGRRLPTTAEAGPPRQGKYVGIFYFLWHGAHGTQGPFDITKILAANPTNPQWGPLGAPHHWGEPELGYYLAGSEYVLRKHAQMLSDAGVDVVVFDVTNGYAYTEQYLKLGQVWSQVRAEGGATPQIMFLAPFWTVAAHQVVQSLYDNLYGPGLYQDLWFLWEGKPLILADPAVFNWTLKGFFTFRVPQPKYFEGPTGPDQWGWLEVWPQHGFYNSAGQVEEVAVGVAQNAVGQELAPMSDPRGAKGRSWLGRENRRIDHLNATSVGYNFLEQWSRALELDPSFVFVTGFNEWVAARLNEWQGSRLYTDPNGGIFVDGYTQEYSRDVEPMKGGHGDNYYYQLVSGIRRFKGVRPAEEGGPPRTIFIDGRFEDWASVGPTYYDTPADALPRNEPGWGSAGPYVNATGRNDFVQLKVARDDEYVYFYAQTREPITPFTDPHWMLLFIDADQNPATGWEGYDYAVNLEVKGSGLTTLKASAGGAKWTTVKSDIRYAVSGNQMELAVPRTALGQAGSGVSLDFHWADNIQKLGDVAEFSVSGDSAPNRRFNYRYVASD